MIVAGVDLETTGLEPGDHRIIEVYVGLYDLKTRGKQREYLRRINPLRTILPDAQKVHGISLADLHGEPTWNDVASEARAVLESADLIVGHNYDEFDAVFLNHEFKRVGLPKLTRPSFDTMVHGRWATPTGAVPNLGILCFACGVEYDTAKAHAADYDVDVMMQCFFKGLDWGWFQLPDELKAAA